MHDSRPSTTPTPRSDEQRFREFGHALDALRAEVEADLGTKDLAHIERVCRLSRHLELLGRTFIHGSLEPFSFGVGVLALSLHKSLELMEIGHMALHGAYDRLSNDDELHAAHFKWKAPIDEANWKVVHNVRHHQYTNIVGRDPDIDFGALRLSAQVPYRWAHRLQPATNMLTWLGFSVAIALNASGVVGEFARQGGPRASRSPARTPEPTRGLAQTFILPKAARYYLREFALFPALAGPFFWKVALGNLLSEVNRDIVAGAIIYCGHVGTTDYQAETKAGSRGRWYAMQVESARDVELSPALSVLCGALDYQIEHHLFPRLPPNRLREIAPRVRALCAEFGVVYRSAGWPETLVDVIRTLRKLSKPAASSRGSARRAFGHDAVVAQ